MVNIKQALQLRGYVVSLVIFATWLTSNTGEKTRLQKNLSSNA